MPFKTPIALDQFAPDADPRNPGVLVDTDGVFPSMKGLRTLPSLEPASAKFTDHFRGTYAATLPAGSVETFSGTATHLYKFNGHSWDLWDSGQPTFSVNDRWTFASFGKYVLAAGGQDVQVFDTSGPGQFVKLSTIALTNGPGATVLASALIVEVVDDGVFLIPPDSQQWAFSLSATEWEVGSQFVVFVSQLDKTPGPIRGFKRIRGGVVAYKDRSMLFGQFTGDPLISGWNWTIISETVGCSSNDAIINTGDLHLFPSGDDFYLFDGSSLQKIPSQLKEWFFNQMSEPQLQKILGVWDRVNSLATWYYPSQRVKSDHRELDRSLIFNTRTQRWTHNVPKATIAGTPLVIEDVVLPSFTSGFALTYAQFATLFKATGQTYADIPPTMAYDSPKLGVITGDTAGVIGDDHVLYAADPAKTAGGYITTGEIGDGAAVYQLSRLRPLLESPTGLSLGFTNIPSLLQAYSRRYNGGQRVTGPTAALTADGAFNFMQTARVHQLKISLLGPFISEITSITLDIQKVGEE